MRPKMKIQKILSTINRHISQIKTLSMKAISTALQVKPMKTKKKVQVKIVSLKFPTDRKTVFAGLYFNESRRNKTK